MSRKKLDKKNSPKVNPKLNGFDIKIDPFGEINSTYSIDKINQFLNKHVDDKKLRDREDLDELKEGKAQGEDYFNYEESAPEEENDPNRGHGEEE